MRPASNPACLHPVAPIAWTKRSKSVHGRLGMADDLKITVNGKTWPVGASPDTPLLYVLANELGLKGPRFGCGLAQCGSCSVFADGVEIRSCITPVADVAGKTGAALWGPPGLYSPAKRAAAR